MTLDYTTRPLSDRTWLRPADARSWSQFESTWRATLNLLGRELELLRAHHVVVEVDVPERAIRNDGQLRADARADSPAVVLAFGSPDGPMLYRCDRFETRWVSKQGPSWQQNVRAIALGLEALRKVERYGIADTGQQYTGFKALGAGRAMPSSHMTSDEALILLRLWAAKRVEVDPDMTTADLHKHARRAAHPDHNGGNHSHAALVLEAGRVLGVAQ